MRSCPQARQFAEPVDPVQLDTPEQLIVDPYRKFHRAMLQVVDKTLGVSFCECCRKRSLSFHAAQQRSDILAVPLQSTIS